MVTLNRLLSRLNSQLLSESADLTRFQQSQFERNKISSNIEYARTILLTAEKQASTLRVQSQRQEVQADLQTKRSLIKQMNSRLKELEEFDGCEEESDDEDNEEDGDDHNVSYAPAQQGLQNGLDTGEPPGLRLSESQQAELRSRKPLSASDNHTAASTTAREQLFGSRSRGQPTAPSSASLSQTETLLSHNRTEQETLTSSLLSLASALKESSLQFSSSLEAEKDVMKRAEGGLDKNAQGMEAAERKMSMLRRMSEGQGWWGRIKLYAFIFALWVGCFLVVFIGPKLRL